MEQLQNSKDSPDTYLGDELLGTTNIYVPAHLGKIVGNTVKVKMPMQKSVDPETVHVLCDELL